MSGREDQAADPPGSVTGAAFGPAFFSIQLGAYARDRCPKPAEGLPAVEVHLATGEVLDLCHVMGLAPGYVALAIRESIASSGEMRMRTELVPYSLIVRVTIRSARESTGHVGFNADQTPRWLPETSDSATQEASLLGAATPGSRR
jgi:hypothetical protein